MGEVGLTSLPLAKLASMLPAAQAARFEANAAKLFRTMLHGGLE
ncbi:MAG TPA: hypothetical protein VE733_06305 [Streptosporangiaceae bacterium]|nr:hypothetical protein [Streptosporangiaceae bacterium]